MVSFFIHDCSWWASIQIRGFRAKNASTIVVHIDYYMSITTDEIPFIIHEFPAQGCDHYIYTQSPPEWMNESYHRAIWMKLGTIEVQ